MELIDLIKAEFPGIAEENFWTGHPDCTIKLQNDSDGTGTYIREWNYSEPLPSSLTQYLRNGN